jgi:deoxyribose-phosphate aldolase
MTPIDGLEPLERESCESGAWLQEAAVSVASVQEVAQVELNRYLDAAVLKPETTQQEARGAVEAMVEAATITVCVRPCDILLARGICEGSQTRVSCVLAFPHGVSLSESKADEGRRYVDLGVAEVDMVANYGLIRSGEWVRFQEDLALVREATRGALLKVILETSELTREQVSQATEIAADVGADFVKTSTGFASGGATEEAVKTMVNAAADRISVKASGGIRTREQAERYVALGARRLGVNYTTAASFCGVEVPAVEESGRY